LGERIELCPRGGQDVRESNANCTGKATALARAWAAASAAATEPAAPASSSSLNERILMRAAPVCD